MSKGVVGGIKAGDGGTPGPGGEKDQADRRADRRELASDGRDQCQSAAVTRCLHFPGNIDLMILTYTQKYQRPFIA